MRTWPCGWWGGSAAKILKSLGVEPGTSANSVWQKPKRMHCATFSRKLLAARRAEARATDAWLGLLSGYLTREGCDVEALLRGERLPGGGGSHGLLLRWIASSRLPCPYSPQGARRP
jgi:hypothetical protein